MSKGVAGVHVDMWNSVALYTYSVNTHHVTQGLKNVTLKLNKQLLNFAYQNDWRVPFNFQVPIC